MGRQKDWSKRLALLWILVLCFAASAGAEDYYRTFDDEGLRVTIDIWSTIGSPGYVPITLDISNKLRERVITISSQTQKINNGMWGYGAERSGTLDVLVTIRLKPGDERRLTIPLPVGATNENGLVRVTEGRSRVLHTAPFYFQTSVSPDLAPVMIVADPSSDFEKVARDLPRKTPPSMPPAVAARYPMPGPGAAGGIDVVREPARLPGNWLGFTTLRAVIIGVQEWKSLSEAQKDALLAWAAAGGDLCLVDGAWSDLFPQADRRPVAMGAGGASERYFLGQLFFTSSGALSEKGIEPFLNDFRNGPNRWYALSPPGRTIVDPAAESLRTEVKKPRPHAPGMVPNYTSWRLPLEATAPFSAGPDNRWGFRLPIPGVGIVSTRIYLAIMTLFTVLIGPVNYAFLKRRRQQVLMVLTTPIISVAFIALLAGYAVAGEGLGVRSRAETFTFLDQASKQAATRATVSQYAAGMAPWAGLRFPRDVAIVPTGPNRELFTWGGGLDLTDAQRYPSGLLQARTPLNFDEVAFRTARERLTFTRAGEGVSVSNGLGVAIQHLYYRAGGRVYTLTAAVAPGAQGGLEPGAGKDLAAALHLNDADPGTLAATRADEFQHFFLDSLSDGAFFAVVDQSPFWNPGGETFEERGGFHVIAGYTGEEL
ncbi:MAG TPA: hypothetical protein VFY29_16950 [Terriglobia bacterium]|nr:hypothetical protein [Terriglobia bacterium]